MLSLNEWLTIFISVFAVLLVKQITSAQPSPILSIYQKPGNFYWCKVIVMYIFLNLKKLKYRPINWEYLDKAQNLSNKKKPIDSVFFTGSCSNGSNIVVSMTKRNKSLTDTYMILKVSDKKTLVLPNFPTTFSLKDKSNDFGFESDGITIEPKEAMKRWHISYEGKLKDCENDTLHDIVINLEFHSKLPWFNFSTDRNIFNVAKALAREFWNKDYFKMLKSVRQSYYEQCGKLEGTILVDDEKINVEMDATRYHTFGHHRDWRNFHRYIMHFIHTENGDKISVGVISMPITVSSLLVGCLYCEKTKKIHALQECDLKLYQHGEKSNAPTDYSFSIRAGGRDYVIEVEVTKTLQFYLSENYEAKMLERFCNFSVNGIRGWGISEWQYRNI